jgi:hypothetical protein
VDVSDTYTILMGKLEEMIKVESPTFVSENNEMNLKRVSYKDVKVDSSGSGQDVSAYCLKYSNNSKVFNTGRKVSELRGRLLSSQYELWRDPLLNYLLLLCIRKAISLRRDHAKEWTLVTDDKILIRTIK